jgi:hypothetical protein
MAIIPGVPTPKVVCGISPCASIYAQVSCLLMLLQGTTGCIDIQLFDKDKLPLNSDDIQSMQIMLFNEFNCVIAEYYYPVIPELCQGYLIESLQYVFNGHIIDEGLFRICLTESVTSTIPSAIFAEIRLEMKPTYTGDIPDIVGIRCLQIANILPSKIYQLGCNGLLTGGNN